MVYDVIVVGLGPAGATASYELSKAGFNVLALEEKKLPRYKPCAGGLSLKIEKVLSFPDWRDLIENAVYDLILSYKGKDSQRFHSEKPLAYIVSRDKFDYYLANQARKAKAEIHEEEVVSLIHENANDVDVHSVHFLDKQYKEKREYRYRARYVIGADGGFSQVGISLCAPHFEPDTALNGLITEVEAEVNPSLDFDKAIYIYFGMEQKGYGWIFPKSTKYVVGMTQELGKRRKRKEPPEPNWFEDFMANQQILKNIKRQKLVGHIIPRYQDYGHLRYTDRVLLVGDAAGLVDPFLGEGIYYAIRSGQLAAQTIQKALSGKLQTLAEYEERVNAEIGKE
ncbi:MAG: NAD(P)/FAD-dependent oxidoreductase, partial [bacterium]|nr:NAD(P)/FAD-dependent oxidoreductase [bacterium]